MKIAGTKRIIAAVLTVGVLSTALLGAGAAPSSAPANYTQNRLYGNDRYATSVAISQKGFKSASSVIVVSGENFPDALAAVPAAQALQCPILLASSAGLSSDAMAEIKRLGVKDVYILGGSSVVPRKAVSQLNAAGFGADQITRIAGVDRFETAALVAAKFLTGAPASTDPSSSSSSPGTSSSPTQPPSPTPSAPDTVVIANAFGFADALSMGPVAGLEGWPILFTDTSSLPAVTLNYIKTHSIKKVVIVGGVGVVSNAVQTKLTNLGLTVTRVGGTDRYDTSYKIVKTYQSLFAQKSQPIAVATGLNFPDALSGGALAEALGAPMILVDPNSAPSGGIVGLVAAMKSDAAYVFGGTAVVPDFCVRRLFGVASVSTLTKEDGTGEIALGMKAADFVKVLKAHKVSYIVQGCDYVTDDGVRYAINNGVLAQISLTAFSAPTQKGLKVTDPLSRMTELFGKGYVYSHASDETVQYYRYTYGGNYFTVMADMAGKIVELDEDLKVSEALSTALSANDQCPVRYTAKKGTVDCFIQVAVSQVGYREGSYNASTGKVDFPGNQNWSKYGAWYSGNSHLGVAYAWCAYFVSWCAAQSGLKTVPRYGYCGYGIEQFGKRYHTSFKDGPLRVGDVIFYGNDHTGICIKVNANGSYDSVEGNTVNYPGKSGSGRICTVKNHFFRFNDPAGPQDHDATGFADVY